LRRFASAQVEPRRFNDGLVNILFLGRLERRKGVMVLVRAYQKLRKEGLPVRLIIAGGGHVDADLRKAIMEENIPDIVLAGEFSVSDTARWYAESDIVCAPSPYGESFGIVVAEAMASGKPVVAAANAGYRMLLTGEQRSSLQRPASEPLHERLRDLV
jgi:phosphatidylinositol alpha-mannosyltransferase